MSSCRGRVLATFPLFLCLALAALVPRAAAQSTPKVSLETSETLFSVVTAMNSCGYDQDLAASEPIRAQVRNEVMAALRASEAARTAHTQMCGFYRDHQQPDASRDLSHYISLALYLGAPPAFDLSIREADLPPDAGRVLGFVPLLQHFYDTARLHEIWLKHKPQYDEYLVRLHPIVSDMILKTDYYLKLPISGYLGRRLAVYAEPMAAPGQTNARNFGNDYYLVLSPSTAGVKIDPLRHTYLHFVLEPLAYKHYNSIKVLEPILYEVRTAPMDNEYKNDAALMVTESLIRAIEARTLPGVRGNEALAVDAVSASMKQGFVLTEYFYRNLREFEKSPAGLEVVYGDWLHNIDVGAARKRASQIEFSKQSTPEILRAVVTRRASVLDLAEERLSTGDVASAQRLAQQIIDDRSEDPARALFILARAATRNRDMKNAQTYFERTLQVAREPRILAWTHIYLGRIFDLQQNRESAILHYRSALAAGDPTPDTASAAQKGLQQPYAPPAPASQ